MAMLIQNQTALVAQLAEYNRAHSFLERQYLELKRQSDERFARIEAQMAQIIGVLNEHSRLLERLSEAIRDKNG
jgi:serine protease inhibitor ecotin